MKRHLLTTILAVLASAGGAQAQARFPPQTSNAALRYWAALVQMRDPSEDQAARDSLTMTLLGKTAWDETKLGPILDANADALQTMQRGTKLSECNWGLDYQLGNLNTVALVMRARGLERLNTAQGIRELAKGDGEAAVDTWLAGIRFSQDLGRGGPAILALVASAMLMDTLQAVAENKAPEKLDEVQKKELYAALRAMPEDGFDWGVAWGVEYAIGDQFLQELQRASDPRAVYKRLGISAPKGLPPTQQDIQRYGEYMLAAQGALREPPEKAKPLLDDLESRERSFSEVVRLLLPNPLQCNRARTQVVAAREGLMQALAPR